MRIVSRWSVLKPTLTFWRRMRLFRRSPHQSIEETKAQFHPIPRRFDAMSDAPTRTLCARFHGWPDSEKAESGGGR